jgi:hypothetical protein
VAVVNGAVGLAKEVIKGVRPVDGGERGALEHSSDGIADCLVGTLGQSVLVRGVGAGELHFVPVARKKFPNGVTLAEFAALVSPNVMIKPKSMDRP